MTALWRCWGDTDVVIGHSMGEVSGGGGRGAEPGRGAGVIATRSRLLARLAGQGAMALLELDPGATEVVIADPPGCDVGGVRLPRQTVIAGPPAGRRGDRGGGRPGPVGAAHRGGCGVASSDHRSGAAGVAGGACRFRRRSRRPSRSLPPPRITPQPGQCFDAEYWAANLRNLGAVQPGRRHRGRRACHLHRGQPHPLLTHAISDTLPRFITTASARCSATPTTR